MSKKKRNHQPSNNDSPNYTSLETPFTLQEMIRTVTIDKFTDPEVIGWLKQYPIEADLRVSKK